MDDNQFEQYINPLNYLTSPQKLLLGEGMVSSIPREQQIKLVRFINFYKNNKVDDLAALLRESSRGSFGFCHLCFKFGELKSKTETSGSSRRDDSCSGAAAPRQSVANGNFYNCEDCKYLIEIIFNYMNPVDGELFIHSCDYRGEEGYCLLPSNYCQKTGVGLSYYCGLQFYDFCSQP